MATAAGALGAISSVSMMAGGAALSMGGLDAGYAMHGLAAASAQTADATAAMSQQRSNQAQNMANLKTAVKVVGVASRVLRIAGVPMPW